MFEHWAEFFSQPGGALILKIVLLTLPAIPNLWAIYHAYNREFPTVQEKMAWIGAGVFVPVIGGLVYLFIGRRRAIRPGTGA